MSTARVRRAGVQHIKPQARVVERIDPEENFDDVIGNDTTRFTLENARPDRRYAWPEETHEDMARFRSGELGVRYNLETYQGDDDPDALRPVGAQGLLKKGDSIRVGTHVLMSCDRALWEKRQRLEAKRSRQTSDGVAQLRTGDVVASENGPMSVDGRDLRAQAAQYQRT